MSQVMEAPRSAVRTDSLRVVADKRAVVCADCRFAQLWAVHGGAFCTHARGAGRPVPPLARACDGAMLVDPTLTDLHCVKA